MARRWNSADTINWQVTKPLIQHTYTDMAKSKAPRSIKNLINPLLIHRIYAQGDQKP
jgi:hypothetical protein